MDLSYFLQVSTMDDSFYEWLLQTLWTDTLSSFAVLFATKLHHIWCSKSWHVVVCSFLQTLLGGEASWWLVILLARDIVDLPPCWLQNILAVSQFQALRSWGRAEKGWARETTRTKTRCFSHSSSFLFRASSTTKSLEEANWPSAGQLLTVNYHKCRRILIIPWFSSFQGEFFGSISGSVAESIIWIEEGFIFSNLLLFLFISWRLLNNFLIILVQVSKE